VGRYLLRYDLPAVRIMYVNTKSPCFCLISVCSVLSSAGASSRCTAHLRVRACHIQDAPTSWAADRLAYCFGCPSGGLHVLQINQQVSFTANGGTARRKVAYCNLTERIKCCACSSIIRSFGVTLLTVSEFVLLHFR